MSAKLPPICQTVAGMSPMMTGSMWTVTVLMIVVLDIGIATLAKYLRSGPK